MAGRVFRSTLRHLKDSILTELKI
ncbi:unnamed protein product [Urochloa humidicola]